jgi:cation diffusion facilitator CzcD-associated flavoprotein CzcO
VPDTTTVIIGAGHCGLAMSHCLAARSLAVSVRRLAFLVALSGFA